MDESQGTLRTSIALRKVYNEVGRSDFVKYVCLKFDMDLFTAELIWETINVVGDLGVRPDHDSRRSS